MWCPDDSDQSGKVGSEYWTRIRSPSSFILMRQSKTKCSRVPYGTECGPGCRCRVRSPLLCRTEPFYVTGARADARIRTSVLDPHLNPQTTYRILKLNCKHMNGSIKREARILISFKNIMFKFFLKLLGETRTRIRILGSGSIKKLIKPQSADDSGSGRGPDRQIIPKECKCMWLRWIRYGPPPPDPIGLELFLCRVTRHLGHLSGPGNAMPWVWTIPSRSGKPQTHDAIFYHYHIMVISPELTRYGRASIPTRPVSLGLFLRMPRCRVGILMLISLSFSDVWKEFEDEIENQTDNRRKDSYQTFSSFWANSQCKIFNQCIFLLICWNYVKITVWSNWDFELMAGDWEFEKWTIREFWIALLCSS
jgi:hypothetical protein